MDEFHTGEECPTSGIWQPAGGGKEIALSKGEVFPPSDGQGVSYELVRETVDPDG